MRGTSMVVVQSSREEIEDAFWRKLVLSEEDRQRLFPKMDRAGGYRWFKSANVVPLEQARAKREREIK